MPTTKVTDAVAEPVTLEDAKAHLRVDGTQEQALINALIAAARTAAEERLGITLLKTTWALTLDAFPCGTVVLPRGPILGVTSVSYYDADGAQQTLDPGAYRLGDRSLEPTDAWPATQPRRTAAVRIVYDAGYGTVPAAVPAPIKAWVLLALGDLYANREASAERPVVTQGFADGLLEPYKVWEPQ